MEAMGSCCRRQAWSVQAYELVQGPLVRWSEQQSGQRPPPTAVMVHGILGSRKNMQAYAHRLVEVHHPLYKRTCLHTV